MGSFEAFKGKEKSLKKEIRALRLATKRDDVPLPAKLLVIIVVAYALSPVDLIPDFIPVLGCLDDLILVPLGIWLAIKMVPACIMEECRQEAELSLGEKLVSWTAGLIVIIVWILVTAAAFCRLKAGW